MNVSRFILCNLCGWSAHDTLPVRDKCIICVAPHTSNWDFIIGQLYYRSIGRKAGFLMKQEWFWGPLGWLFRKMGGMPVYRQQSQSTTDLLAQMARESDHFVVAITPEGTRKVVSKWKHGFYYAALKANIPIQCYALDYAKKQIIGTLEIHPSGDLNADMCRIMDYYRSVNAKHPLQFQTEEILS